MTTACDMLILGTGYFAEIMLNDIAATAEYPLRIVVAGRNAERMAWLVTAANARSAMFDTGCTFEFDVFDLSSEDSIACGLAHWNPQVIVQSSSLQSPWKVDGRDSDWAALVNDAGFGFTLALQSMLPTRTARAMCLVNSKAAYVNTCYPDVVNQVLHAQALPITCGVGNIAIFSTVVAGCLPREARSSVKVLAHHNHLVEWRKPGSQRSGRPIRVWLDDTEQTDVAQRFAHIQLPFRDLNVISGGSAVPVLLALAGAGNCDSHVPGPAGLPGGYPVKVRAGAVSLNLPAAVTESEAVDWNRGFEAIDGASVSESGQVTYSERARAAIERYSPEVAKGFNVAYLDQAFLEVASLRARLGG